jgi:hypothetical protein
MANKWDKASVNCINSTLNSLIEATLCFSSFKKLYQDKAPFYKAMPFNVVVKAVLFLTPTMGAQLTICCEIKIKSLISNY